MKHIKVGGSIVSLVFSFLAFILGITVYFFKEGNPWQVLLICLGFSILLFLTVNFDELENFRINWEKKEIELKKTAEQIMLTKEQFDKTTQAFVAYNLAETEKIGLSFADTRVLDLIDFVQSAKQIVDNSDDRTGRLHRLLDIAQVKVFSALEYEIDTRYREISEEAKKLMCTGSLDGNAIVPVDRGAVLLNFEKLKELAISLPKEKQGRWLAMLAKVEKYYIENFE